MGQQVRIGRRVVGRQVDGRTTVPHWRPDHRPRVNRLAWLHTGRLLATAVALEGVAVCQYHPCGSVLGLSRHEETIYRRGRGVPAYQDVIGDQRWGELRAV